MRQVVRMEFGSHLYGTDTPGSDRDYMTVVVPDARDILLQRTLAARSRGRQKGFRERNTSEDVDDSVYGLQRFMGLLAEGQTGALDMLFAPQSALLHRPAAEWPHIQLNRDRVLTRRSAAFVGYCRQQANKYGIKGSRVAAARRAERLLSAMMDELQGTVRLGELEGAIAHLCEGDEHMSLVDIPGATGLDGVRREVRHWEVCNRKMPLTQTIGDAHALMGRLVAAYGQRAYAAESNEGVDWKAVSHAVRVGHEALELLRAGTITFPRPERAHLLRIKAGLLPYAEVAAEIEALLPEVEAASAASTLPDEPDHGWIDDFVAGVHRDEVLRG